MYLFRTWALDLGFYTHIMYNYAHLRSNSFFMFDMDYVKVLCDHFDLYLLLLSPLVYVLIPASYLEKKHPDGDALWRNKDAFEVVETDGNLFLMKRSEN